MGANMNYKKIFLTVLLIFCVLLSASVVSASDDTVDVATAEGFSSDEVLADDTVDGLDDEEGILAASENEPDDLEATTYENAVITSGDADTTYQSGENYPLTDVDEYEKEQINMYVSDITGTYPYATLKATVKYADGSTFYGGFVSFVINGKTYEADVIDGVATKKVTLPHGTFNCIASYDDDFYYSNDASFKVVVNKANAKLTMHPWISTTKQYTTLKVIVKDQNGKKINEGAVKFKINGKTYKVNVKNGVATKKIKLRKAKVYKLKSTFSSNNFNTKTASSKVYVKKAKKWYKFKVGKLVGKISCKQYTKFLKCHNEGKYKEITIKTGKYKTYKVPKYTYKKVKKSKWKYKKVLSYEAWGDAYGSQWEEYDDWEYYTNHGWTWYATSYDDNDYDDGSFYYATYYKLKKKVKVTVKKKVQNGYKTAKYPIRMYVFCSDLYDGFGVGFYDNYEGYLGSKSLSIKKF